MSSSFKRGPKPQQDPKPQQAPVEKATGPMGSKIVPESFNGAASGETIGGWVDATAQRGMALGATARGGRGKNARASTADPTMSPPTPAPNGRDMGNRPNPHAPPSMTMAAETKGASQGPRAESAAPAMAKLARGGGKVGSPGVGQPTRHQAPALPTPEPTFPDATPAYKPAVPMPTGRGTMSGVIQGGSGVRPGRSDLSPLRNRRPGPQ